MRSLILAGLVLPVAMAAQPIGGSWQATVQVNGIEIPFRIEFQGSGSGVSGTLFNGEQRFTSTGGQLAGDSLTLEWEYMASRLEAKLAGGTLEGKYLRANNVVYPFHATRAGKAGAAEKAPSIAGMWVLTGVHSSKGESAWQFIVRQKGAEASAAILRVDGDTGTLDGSYKNGKFVLSHFSGMRPALVEVSPQSDGTLKVVLNGKEEMTAVRASEAR